ncbi:hypothetical protein HispidOSU_020131 [Sigmodon hispidus]
MWRGNGDWSFGGTRDVEAKDAETHRRSHNASQLIRIWSGACWDLSRRAIEDGLLWFRYFRGLSDPFGSRWGRSREARPAALRRAVRDAAPGRGGSALGRGGGAAAGPWLRARSGQPPADPVPGSRWDVGAELQITALATVTQASPASASAYLTSSVSFICCVPAPRRNETGYQKN